LGDFAEKKAQAPATVEEVYALLSAVAADIFAPPQRRRQAALARGSQTPLSEYAGVLTVWRSCGMAVLVCEQRRSAEQERYTEELKRTIPEIAPRVK